MWRNEVVRCRLLWRRGHLSVSRLTLARPGSLSFRIFRASGFFSSNCRLRGTLPSTLCSLTNLTSVEMYGCKSLSGSIPRSVVSLSLLKTLHLHSNILSGQLPNQIQALNQLTSLRTALNPLSGSLPDDWPKALQYVYMNQESLVIKGQIHAKWHSGTLPRNLFTLPALRSIWLYTNKISGTLPASLRESSALDDLRITGGEVGSRLAALLNRLHLHSIHKRDTL